MKRQLRYHLSSEPHDCACARVPAPRDVPVAACVRNRDDRHRLESLRHSQMRNKVVQSSSFPVWRPSLRAPVIAAWLPRSLPAVAMMDQPV